MEIEFEAICGDTACIRCCRVRGGTLRGQLTDPLWTEVSGQPA